MRRPLLCLVLRVTLMFRVGVASIPFVVVVVVFLLHSHHTRTECAFVVDAVARL